MGRWKIAVLALGIAACSPGFEPEDAKTDAGADAGRDAGADPGSDPGADPGSDPGADPGSDPGLEPGDGVDGDGHDGFPDGEDGSPDGSDGDQPPDYDPQESFLITVPPGISLCSTFCESRTWQQELAMLGRIDLAPGTYVLPRQIGSTPGAFVSRVLFGPDQAEVASLGEGGEFIASYHDWSWGAESWEYNFVQQYLQDHQPFEVEVYFSFYSDNAQWPAETVAGDDFPMTATVRIGPGEDYLTERQVFSACGAPPLMTVELATQGGDRLTLDKGMCQACMCAGNTSCYFFRNAQVNLESLAATVEEHFSLVYSAGHHNDGEMFLIRLDPPDGALLVQAPPLASSQGGILHYLDDDLTELRQEDIVQWEVGYP